MDKYIRNISIIAHIDHGKSTFSDRIIEICNKKKFKKNEQRILDNMELEQEKGITIKAQTVCLNYKLNNINYKINLIDTPGHIDFTYEVTKSLYACEGALLLIDITKGIQAQTVANLNIANKLNIKIIPIINKIDIPNINIKKLKLKIKNKLHIHKKILLCSAKTGIGIKSVMNEIIKKIPYPNGNINNKLQALIIDSYFNNYLGTYFLIKINNGIININDKIRIIDKKKYICKIKYIIIYVPEKKYIKTLKCGEVGWIICNIKNINRHFIGKTITNFDNLQTNYIIKKFNKITPQIFAGIYPEKNNNFENLKKSLHKLSINDSSLTFKPENSILLGLGFKCGFLGKLHIDIIKERLKREYNINIIILNPSVTFKIIDNYKKKLYVNNYSKLPKLNNIKKIQEPISLCKINSPKKYLGKIINLCVSKRGKFISLKYINNNIYIKYNIPLCEIITDFNDKLKSITKGYASLNYKFIKYQTSNIVTLQAIINNIIIKGLSKLIHKSQIKIESLNMLDIIKNNIKKHQFDIIIQISCNNKIIAKTHIKALRKNVTSKCYGGDITRKKKLIKKQKIGKKRMKKIGNVSLSNKLFNNILNKKK